VVGKSDSIGAQVYDVLFRGCDYAIYRSDRGIYVHFSDDEQKEQAQRRAYSLLCGQICELRYLTAQMRLKNWAWRWQSSRAEDSLYDHNMAQALMLLMESEAQRAATQTQAADDMAKRAEDIANRALDMAVRRVTVDNTIRYVSWCILFGLIWIVGSLFVFLGFEKPTSNYSIASLCGAVGAMFSVIVRAQSLELKPCDDSRLNKVMGMVRVGMGGIAGPALLLLLMATGFAKPSIGGDITNAMQSGASASMAAILGLVGGFAERLVPNLVRSTAEKMDSRAGTPVQATKSSP
jgi:hypothetical protein